MITPNENFARARREAESLIRLHAPASSRDELIALLRPAIALNAAPTDDAQIALGASKFGGAPDVPANFRWPKWNGKSLGFLAQINLGELAPFGWNNDLPLAGMLSFFVAFDEENPVWGEPEQRESWRVFYSDEPLHRVTPPADSGWIVAQNTQIINLEAVWNVSQDEMNSLDLDWDDAQWSHFGWDVLEIPPHRMLGCAYAPQISPFVVAANGVQNKTGFALYNESVATDDWVLLLQLDTGAGEFFADIHDMGWLYFLIRRDDLAKGDFSKVWFNEQCT